MRTATVRKSTLSFAALALIGFAGSAAAATLTVTPNPVDLGGTQIGMSLMTTVTVANMGLAKIGVMSAAVTVGGPAYTLSNVPNFPVQLNPGTSFNMTVQFTPSMNGVTSGTMTVVSNDPNNPMLAVPLSGYAGPAAIALDAGSVAFGNVNMGASSTPQIINIQNVGFSNLDVTDIQIAGMVGDFILDKKNAVGAIPPMMMQPFAVTFKPTMLGSRSATITVVSAAGNKMVALLGTGTSSMMTVAPAMIAIGNQRAGMTSAPMNVTVSNAGTGTLEIMSLNFTGPGASAFSVMGMMAPISVGPNASTKLPIVCKPAMIGALTGTLTVVADVGMASVALTCTGVAPMISVAPATLDFGMVNVMATSMNQSVTITNNGTDVLNISDISVVGANLEDFNFVNQPATPLAIPPLGTSMFQVNFMPSSGGAETASVLIDSDDPVNMGAMVNLTGTGIMAGYTVMPTDTIDFMMVSVNTTSMKMPIVITNSGDGPVTVTSVTIMGMNQADFATDFTKAVTLAMNDTATVNATFSPSMVGVEMSTLTINTDGGLMPTMVPLMGTGISPTIALSPLTFNFGTVLVGNSSSTATATIVNTGTSALTIGSIASTDPAFVVNQTATMLNLAANSSTTFQVVFTPTVVGMKGAEVGVTLKGQPKAALSLMVTGIGSMPTMSTGMHGGNCTVDPRPKHSLVGVALLAGLVGAMLLRRRRARSSAR